MRSRAEQSDLFCSQFGKLESSLTTNVSRLSDGRDESKESAQRELRFAETLDEMVATLNRIKSRNTTDDEVIDDSGKYTDAVPSAWSLSRPMVSSIQHQVIDALSQHDAIYDGLVQRLFNPKDKGLKPHRLVAVDDELNFQNSVMNSLLDGVFPEIDDREEAIPQPYMDTYSWVFQRSPLEKNGKPAWSSFPAWLESKTRSPFWITGKPGSGKSTLMKYILHHKQLMLHLRKWAGNLPLETTSFFAWIAGSDLQSSTQGLMRTVLYRCLKLNRELTAVVAPRRWSLIGTLRNCSRQPPWEDWELYESFNLLLSHIVKFKRVAFFIDGLDEFKIMPAEILRLIQGLCARDGIKVCVASRQWLEFNDKLDGYPMLRMQDLTRDDTLLFVQGSLREDKGFHEQRNIYGAEVDSLVYEIVDKSNGVFLWAHLVLKSLLQAFAEGDGLIKLRAILQGLPGDLDELYSKIWTQVEERQSNFARLMALKRAAYGHLYFLNLWLADDPQSVDMWNLTAPSLKAIRSQMTRRLDRNTRGILELSRSDNVEYLHRTASDWAARNDIWENIRSHLDPDFDACLGLLHAEVLMCRSQCDRPEPSDQRVYEVLRYAHRIENSTNTRIRMLQILDEFNADMTKRHDLGAKAYGWVEDTAGWTSRYGCDFFELACRYCATPYLDAKVTQAQGRTMFTEASTSTTLEHKSELALRSEKVASALENVMLGHKYTTLSAVVPLRKRRDTVALLLDRGATVSEKLQQKMLQFDVREFPARSTSREYVEQDPLTEMMSRFNVERREPPETSRSTKVGSSTLDKKRGKTARILDFARRVTSSGYK